MTGCVVGLQIGAEIAIDVCCATVAEVRKRGEKFWGEFEFYLSDLAVGMVLDIVLVTLLAPVAVIGKYPKAVESTGALSIILWVRALTYTTCARLAAAWHYGP